LSFKNEKVGPASNFEAADWAAAGLPTNNIRHTATGSIKIPALRTIPPRINGRNEMAGAEDV
jgi:hypothetical protein